MKKRESKNLNGLSLVLKKKPLVYNSSVNWKQPRASDMLPGVPMAKFDRGI
jgi:hypothetical protein